MSRVCAVFFSMVPLQSKVCPPSFLSLPFSSHIFLIFSLSSLFDASSKFILFVILETNFSLFSFFLPSNFYHYYGIRASFEFISESLFDGSSKFPFDVSSEDEEVETRLNVSYEFLSTACALLPHVEQQCNTEIENYC